MSRPTLFSATLMAPTSLAGMALAGYAFWTDLPIFLKLTGELPVAGARRASASPSVDQALVTRPGLRPLIEDGQ